MVDATVNIEKLTLDDFIRLYEREGAFEILRGERIPRLPPVTLHSTISKRLVALLMQYEAQGIGEVFYETPFVLTDSSDWVKGSRVPDVMFFTAERLATYREQVTDWRNKPFVLVPDLAVEIVSKNDSYSDVADKVQLYLQDGVRLVWVIDPKRDQISVYAPDEPTRFLSKEDILSGNSIIPDFAIPVKQLFE